VAAGAFLTRATLQPYFDKGVPQVVVSAPVKDPEPVLNVVVGCNEVGGCNLLPYCSCDSLTAR
jgi:glyceraldehyde-3-phosphate dehydrogenase/erythrose-4-phosphate dehydrogenase